MSPCSHNCSCLLTAAHSNPAELLDWCCLAPQQKCFKCSHECRNCTPTCRRHRQHIFHLALPSHRWLASHQARGSSWRPGRRRAGDTQLREDTGRVVGVGADSLHDSLHRHPVAALRPAGGCSRFFEFCSSKCQSRSQLYALYGALHRHPVAALRPAGECAFTSAEVYQLSPFTASKLAPVIGTRRDSAPGSCLLCDRFSLAHANCCYHLHWAPSEQLDNLSGSLLTGA